MDSFNFCNHIPHDTSASAQTNFVVLKRGTLWNHRNFICYTQIWNYKLNLWYPWLWNNLNFKSKPVAISCSLLNSYYLKLLLNSSFLEAIYCYNIIRDCCTKWQLYIYVYTYVQLVAMPLPLTCRVKVEYTMNIKGYRSLWT